MANKFNSSAKLISVGSMYGRWTVVEIRSPSSLCRCICGRERLIRNSWMLARRVGGGCHTCANRRIRPGRRKFKSSLSKEVYDKLSATVRNILRRCTDPNHPHWDYYGGRGITVQEDWIQNPSAFVEYLKSLDGFDNLRLVIDRRDNDKGYFEGNLRFVTRSVSQKNKGPHGRRIRVD